jgi:hypothetical protein
MSKEQLGQPAGFGFTEQERLYDRIRHPRFIALLQQSDIVVHEVKDDVNSFGECLFVTVSSHAESGKLLTFWGCGYHEFRERWIADSWQWYESRRTVERMPVVPKEEALSRIKEREAYIRSTNPPQDRSPRAALYELMAELTDEDGALAELEDLEGFGWIFLRDEDPGSEE